MKTKLSRQEKKSKLLAAKPDIDAVIKRHGIASVFYVVNRLKERERLKHDLVKEKAKLNERIREIEAKLQK